MIPSNLFDERLRSVRLGSPASDVKRKRQLLVRLLLLRFSLWSESMLIELSEVLLGSILIPRQVSESLEQLASSLPDLQSESRALSASWERRVVTVAISVISKFNEKEKHFRHFLSLFYLNILRFRKILFSITLVKLFELFLSSPWHMIPAQMLCALCARRRR
jgi:hypothetical protein